MNQPTSALFGRFEQQACTCLAMRAECKVPGADDTMIPMCWLCAHMVADHGASPEDAVKLMDTCKCPGHLIYPRDVLERRARITSAAETRLGKPVEVSRAPASSGATRARRHR